MYRVTVMTDGGEKVDSFTVTKFLTPAQECGILEYYPGDCFYLDIAREPIDTKSDTFAFGNIDISQEDYE